MRSRRRLIAVLALAAMCAPGTWLRTPVSDKMPRDIALTQVSGPRATPVQGWDVAGVWHYSAPNTRRFGGFSALLALSNNRLRSFSDRGSRFTFVEPDDPREEPGRRVVGYQRVEQDYSLDLWDIESATRNPDTGDYWLGYEYFHAIHRFTVASEPGGVRELNDEVEWTTNAGAEAMLRLSDGRFLVMPEGNRTILIYPSDPVEGAVPETRSFATPAYSYVVTDLAQLPDGRVLLLMRNVAWSFPPFDSLIAIGDPPKPGVDEPWKPEVALRFDDVIPHENYEGIAVRPLEDGTIAVWVISDDNLSVMQRTLLVKLLFDPSQS